MFLLFKKKKPFMFYTQKEEKIINIYYVLQILDGFFSKIIYEKKDMSFLNLVVTIDEFIISLILTSLILCEL
jgi:hypothetical protein